MITWCHLRCTFTRRYHSPAHALSFWQERGAARLTLSYWKSLVSMTMYSHCEWPTQPPEAHPETSYRNDSRQNVTYLGQMITCDCMYMYPRTYREIHDVGMGYVENDLINPGCINIFFLINHFRFNRVRKNMWRLRHKLEIIVGSNASKQNLLNQPARNQQYKNPSLEWGVITWKGRRPSQQACTMLPHVTTHCCKNCYGLNKVFYLWAGCLLRPCWRLSWYKVSQTFSPPTA